MQIRKFVLVCVLFLTGCNTYYDPADNYVRGVRWFDRGAYEAAAELWKPMAEAGDCDAQYRYGHLLWLGLGVEKDRNAARSLWQKAANGGQPKAQMAMGNLAFDGPYNIYQCRDDCSPDAAVAYGWYLLAMKNANYKGEREQLTLLLGEMNARLSPTERVKSEGIAAGWTPSPKACNPRNLF